MCRIRSLLALAVVALAFLAPGIPVREFLALALPARALSPFAWPTLTVPSSACLAGEPLMRQWETEFDPGGEPGFIAGSDVGCDAACDLGCDPCCDTARWSAGFQFTFLKPRYDSNPAFTVTESDGASLDVLTVRDFDYDLKLTPRVWLQRESANGVGWRAQYWQFDDNGNSLATSPPANGFGRVDHPAFGNVDIGSTIPSDIFSASTSLNAYAIDLEGTKTVDFCSWWLNVTAGIRHASITQDYAAQLRNANGGLRGRLDYSHRVSGIGPTMSLTATRSVGPCWTFFGMSRAALLFDEGRSRLSATEDADLTTPFTTRRVTQRDDLLPIGELQVGGEWKPTMVSRKGVCAWQPTISAALEGQLWGNVGSATSEQGDLGFFGFNIGVALSH